MHPSVYLIFDEYTNVFLNSRVLPFRNKIEELRGTILTKECFWNDRDIVSIEGLEAFRILVCGNTGTGKSTLINEVFGAELVRFEVYTSHFITDYIPRQRLRNARPGSIISKIPSLVQTART